MLPVIFKSFLDIFFQILTYLFNSFFFFFQGCGHCKKLAPIWEEIGSLLKNVKGLVVAKIDGDANELHPKYSFVGTYPSIAMFK